MINVIIGQTGSGKTYFLKSLIKDIKKNLVLFDTQAEYNGVRNGQIVNNLVEFFKLFGKDSGNLVCRFSDFQDYFAVLHHLKYCKNFVLVIDELGLFASAKDVNPDLKDLTLTHRHRQAVIFLATQSPMYIPTIQLVNATKIFIFHLEKNDVENLKSKIYISEQQEAAIPNLRKPKPPKTPAQYVVIK